MMITLVLGVLLVGCEAQLHTLGRLADNVGNAVIAGASSVTEIANSTRNGNLPEVIVNNIGKEVGGIIHPIASMVITPLTSQCELVKRLLGVERIPKDSLRDEDLDKLNIKYITPTGGASFNLNQAAEQIPKSIGYNPNQPLIVFAHGFLSVPDSERFTSLVEEFHKKGEYNVLALDSSDYIFWFYLRATTYVRYTGERLGRTLAAMMQFGVNPSSIHLIGHSLGAHITAFAGKEFKRLTGQRVGRISGLDPAGPCFFNAGSDFKLNREDADFVDVIHTNDGVLGVTEPAGHVDFYPNGGTQQPGCVTQLCSHERVWKLYAESITNPQAFLAVKCHDWAQFRNKCENARVLMGYGTTPNLRGLFFLQTNHQSPYGLGETGATYKHTEGVIKTLQPLGP